MGKKKRELAAQNAQVEAEHRWWEYACGTARALSNGAPPPSIEVQGIILASDEHARLMTTGQYARLYAAGNGSWSAAPILVAGRPAIVAGAMLGSAIASSRGRSAAAAAATVTWREVHTTNVLLTSHRLLTYSAARGQWLSFWYDAVSEFYPNFDDWSVAFAFSADASPLRLSGPTAPAVALWAAHGVLGDQWRADARMRRLLGTC